MKKIVVSKIKEDIGTLFPQVQELPKSYDADRNESIYKFDLTEFPFIDPDLDNLPLSDKSILTDLVSCSYISKGLLVSEKLMKLISQFQLTDNRFYSASIRYRGLSHPYFWFYLSSDLSEFFDYANCNFYVGRTAKLKEEVFSFESQKELYEEMEKQKSRGKLLKPLQIKLVDELPYDIFTLLPYDVNNIYISDRIANRIVDECITGCEIV